AARALAEANGGAPGPGGDGPGAGRPVGLPPGPVEEVTSRLAASGLMLGGAGLVLGGSPRLAGELLLAVMPRAARSGREMFAATAGRRLARRGIVPLDGRCLRRLDRVDTVVVAAPALLGDSCRVLTAADADTWNRVEPMLARVDPRRAFRPGELVARAGRDRLVAAHPAGRRAAADPGGLALLLWRGQDRTSRPAHAGVVLDGHAEAVLRAARGCGRVVLTEHASVADVTGLADTCLPAGAALADEVRRLQTAGAVVCVVADGTTPESTAALAAADVGIGLARPGQRPPWSADLLCGEDLTDVWRVLQLPPGAAATSRRAAVLSASGSALAALTTIVDQPGAGRRPRAANGRRFALTSGPVSGAAAVALLMGHLAALRADRQPVPPPVLHTDWHALTPEAALRRLPRPRQPADAAAPAPPPEHAPTGPRWVLARAGEAGGRLAQVPAVRRAAGWAAVAGDAARRYAAAVAAAHAAPRAAGLLVGAAASAVLGSTTDALLVTAVSVANAAVSGAQRAHAEGVLRRLIVRNVPMARVVRADGTSEPCRADQLRPGDLIDLAAQDVVPADGRLLAANALEVDEATLTGESTPVAKRVEPTPAAELGERDCMVYEGTTVLAGTGRAVVVATGEATIAGRAAAAAGDRTAVVGVQARLGELTRLALPLTGLSGLAVTALGSVRGLSLRSALGSGVAVAVAAVPEGLPLVATVAQVAAARRLAGLGVLVRSSRVVEALGRADVVCFDKTGTLTEGRLVLREVAVPGPGGEWRTVRADEIAAGADDVTLIGPDPADGGAGEGAGGEDGQLGRRAARVLAVAAAACPRPGERVTHATDRAVLEAVAAWPRLAAAAGERAGELPFETGRGYASTLVRPPGGGGLVLAVKGAPEVLLDRVRLGPAEAAAARAAAEGLARRGLRVLAVACSAPGRRAGSTADLTGLRLLGFVGIADTPRPTAAPAVRRLLDAGLRVIVVTGDHPATASAVAREVGVPNADAVVTGAQLDRLGDAGYAALAGSAAVFARISPEQKVRLVTTLQRLGNVVVMTGDGTNDAAAIRAADVGVAVRGRGTAAATDAADLLLTGAEVTRLADAVLAGRRMWRSITDAVSVLVGGNAGEIAFTLLGAALSGEAPLSPRQLLLVNLLTDMAPAMALAVRARDDDRGHPADQLVARRPRPAEAEAARRACGPGPGVGEDGRDSDDGGDSA
ncbi:MAG: HAD-IC family P-type ATPase, partial [Frankia sp.]|nr:HAD-IC family P-type ATPase [Frankia sp.]